MSALATVVLSAAELEDDDFSSQALAQNLRLDLGAADRRLAELERVAADQEHLAERDRVADAAGELLDPQSISLFDPVLLAAGLEHCVHESLFEGRARRKDGGGVIGRRSIGSIVAL
jgi:hypothetical protein